MKLCDCGCQRELEPGRSTNAKYRLDCTERVRDERKKSPKGYMKGWDFHWLAVKYYNVRDDYKERQHG